MTDNDGSNNIVNNSAVANISKSGETTRTNDTFVTSSDGGCTAVNNVGTNSRNFTCNISIVFYDGAGTWNIAVRINDSSGVFTQNTTQTFTINELTALTVSPGSISFPTVGLTSVNVSARANITLTNTGNDDISGWEATGETINITAVILTGETAQTTFISTQNFTIGTLLDGSPTPSYCDLSRGINTTRLVNTTAISPVNNFTGFVNGSILMAQAIGNQENLSICLLGVPSDLTAQNYSTLKSGALSLSIF